MEQYTQMKSSGVSWIQDIPSTWGIRALFQLAEQVKNKNKDLSEQNLLSLSYGRIKRKDINSPDGLLPASFDGYNIIEANDIVLRLTDLQNDHTSLRVGQAKERGIRDLHRKALNTVRIGEILKNVDAALRRYSEHSGNKLQREEVRKQQNAEYSAYNEEKRKHQSIIELK